VTVLFPLLERRRYTDEEWKLAVTGRCDRHIAPYPRLVFCGRRSSPDSFYRWCAGHDAEVRANYPAEWYGR